MWIGSLRIANHFPFTDQTKHYSPKGVMIHFQEVTEAYFAVEVPCFGQDIGFINKTTECFLKGLSDTIQAERFPTGTGDRIGESVIHLDMRHLGGVPKDCGFLRHKGFRKGQRNIANVAPVVLTPSNEVFPLQEHFFGRRPKIANQIFPCNLPRCVPQSVTAERTPILSPTLFIGDVRVRLKSGKETKVELT